MNWLQLIERRHSVRRYLPDLDAATVNQVRFICRETETLNSSFLELRLVGGEEIHRHLGLGGIGRVTAPWYIAAIARDDRDSLLNLGYSLERVVLRLTGLGLGTCWLGVFDKKAVDAQLELKGAERTRILLAVGRAAAAAKRMGRRIMPKRLAVFAPHSHRDSLPWLTVLEAVRWAPSAINRQPWRLWFTAEGVHLYSVSRPVGKAYTPIEMGIALCHVQAACQQLNLAGQIKETPHPNRKGWEYWASFVRS